MLPQESCLWTESTRALGRTRLHKVSAQGPLPHWLSEGRLSLEKTLPGTGVARGCTRLPHKVSQPTGSLRGGCSWRLLAFPWRWLCLGASGRSWPPLSAPGGSRLAPGGFWSLLAGPGCSWGGLWEVSFLYRKTATGTITNTIIVKEVKRVSFF